MDRRWWTMAAIPAALAWTTACTHPGPSQPDASPSESGVYLPWPDASNSAGCLQAAQLDTEPPPPAPTFEVTGCLWHTLDTGKALAVFIWNNSTDQELVAPYGPTNRVSPGAAAQGQPTSFASGYVDRFTVPFDGALATWSVLGQTVTVSPTSPDCAASCSYYQQLGCMDCTGFWVDTCTVACGDRVCDSVETCASCPVDCDCSFLQPLVDCVLPLAGDKKLASFGYNNRAATGGGLAISPQNQFLPGQPARGQPVRFETGEHHSVFQVTYDGLDLTWTLAGNSVTVPADAPPCSQACASSCAAGTTCVAAQCLASCGDGVCHWEGCASCPDDCACTGDGVCLGDACSFPPRCGGAGPRCGVVQQGRLKTDCGPCPDGQGCHNKICVPICR